MIDAQRVDFIAVPTRDRERAVRFYGKTLSIAIRVPDVAEARAKLEEAGVEFVGEPFDSGVCHGAAFKDPEGNGLLLHRRYAPYADGSMP